MDFNIKPKLKIFIPTSDIKNSTEVYRIKLENGKYETSGFLWDIWKSIKTKYGDKYEIIETFGGKNDTDYGEFVKSVENGTYDVVLATFTHTQEREKVINYSFPIYIDILSVLYSKKTSLIDDFKYVLSKTGKLIGAVIITGILSGVLLNTFDGGRGRPLPQVKGSKYKYVSFLRNFMTGFSAVIGEMGYLAENVGLSTNGIVISMILMIFSFIFVMLIQAQFTRVLIDSENKTLDISKKPLLSLKGYDVASKISHYGGTIIYKDNFKVIDMIKEYNNNNDKYAGVVLLYGHGNAYKHEIYNYKISSNYGRELISLIINQKRHDILEDINLGITEISNNGDLKNICHNNFKNSDNKLCSLN